MRTPNPFPGAAAWLLACSLAAPPSARAQGFDPAVLQRSVVKVTVRSPGGTHSATGFVWQSPNQIVTAMHVVRRGGEIVVECAGRRQSASLVRVLAEADLALLSAQLDGCSPLAARWDAKPDWGAKLYSFGYGFGAQSGITRALEKGSTVNETLDGILPEPAKQEIRRFGSPRIDLPIYYLEGSLLPGFSGAPIVDRDYRVVGVGNGGLENGGSQVSWVIPVGFVDRLLQSSETQAPTGEGPVSANLFSADVNVPETRPLSFTSRGRPYAFVKTKTRSLGELARTSDDPDGVLSLVRRFGGVVAPDAVDRLRFDIWEELDRGIIIAVPEGTPLEIRSAGPTVNWLAANVRTPDGNVHEFQFWEQSGIRGSSGDLNDVPANDPGYFDEVLSEHRAGCTDPGFALCTFDAPVLRIVDFGNGNRILKAGFVLRIDGPDPRLNAYDYISMAVRGDMSFRASSRLTAQAPNGLLKCAEDPRSPYCQDRSLATAQLAALLAVHLTTFANLGSATGQKAVETQYHHNGRYDDPNTLRERFHFGPTAMFFNQRGKIWQERGVGDSMRNFSEIGRDGDYAILSFNTEWVRLPIWGGPFYRSFDSGATWQLAGEIRRGGW